MNHYSTLNKITHVPEKRQESNNFLSFLVSNVNLKTKRVL